MASNWEFHSILPVCVWVTELYVLLGTDVVLD